MSDLQAFNNLGNNLIQAVLVNQRSKLLQAQLARQQFVDQQRAAVEQAQAAKLEQELEMLKRQQVVAKQLGQSMFNFAGGGQAITDNLNAGLGPVLSPNLQQAEAVRAAAELAGGSPSAAAGLFTPRNVTQGSIGVDAFGRQVDNRRPVKLGMNQVALNPDSFAVQGRGLVGGSALGIMDPNTGQKYLDAPSKSAGVDVADRQLERVVLQAYLNGDIAAMRDNDPVEGPQKRALLDMVANVLSRQQGTNAPVQQSTTSNVPQIGEVRKGYIFLGGDPAKPESWRKQ